MNKAIHLLAGMPQAGTALLSSILAQNPRFESAKPGGILDAVYVISKAWSQIPEFQTAPNEPGKLAVMRAILHGYYTDSPQPVAFDKSRSWLGHLETAELLLGTKVKVLVPVRDMDEILARFELLWRQTSAVRQYNLEQKHYIEFQGMEGRCGIWLRPEYVVGLAYARIEDAVQRGFRDRLHFVHYDKLTARPQETMAAIYAFLGEKPFAHDFAHLRQVDAADDSFYDLPGAHQIRPVLAPEPHRAAEVLGSLRERFKGPYVWDVNR